MNILKGYTIRTSCKKKQALDLYRKVFNGSVFHTVLGLEFKEEIPKEALYLYFRDRLVGFVEYGQSPEYFNEFGIKFLGIDEQHRGQKLGRELISEVVKRHKHLVKYLYISLPAEIMFLKKYYLACGFKPYTSLYATKYESGFFCWSTAQAKHFFENTDKLVSSSKKEIFRLQIR